MSEIRQLVREAEADYDGSCVLYFAQAGECGPIKIGITSAARLYRRIEELQNGSAWRVTLRRAIPGSRALERLLHRGFAPLRMNAEWFFPDAELAALAHGGHEPTLSGVTP